MPAGKPRIKILTGAPDAARLCWDEHALLDDWTPHVRRFLKTASVPASASAWRRISRSVPVHEEGYTEDQSSVAATQPTASDGAADDGEDVREQFMEHSIAVHDDLQSSQLALSPLEETTILNSFPTTSSSFTSSEFLSAVELSDAEADQREASLPRYITNLRDLPSARHLESIYPQTIAVNLIAGIMSVLPARSIRTRHGPRDLVELLVGDDTATGFKISFWFAHQDSQGQPARAAPDDPLRAALQGLRIQDVVVVENVALDTFQDKVYGYSLRKSMQRNQTRIELLARNGLDRAAGLGGVEKVEKVKEWVFRLVNPHGNLPRPDMKGGKGAEDVYLPPDTQE